MVAPVTWLTGNPLLAANVATLATFVLSGLGGYLFTRTLTGSRAAGLITGIVLAFNPIRLVFEISHLQVLSSEWMPFVLWGLRRHLDSGRLRPLIGAALAAVALNLSAGYYLVMFPPVLGVYVLWETVARRRLFDRTLWMRLAAWGAAVGAITWPFIAPYIAMQARLGFTRSMDEIVATSASVDGYLAGSRALAVPMLLAGLAWLPSTRTMARPRLALWAAVTTGLAAWLSLGPAPRWGAATYPAFGLYRYFYEYVPGFDAVRVPSRYSIMFILALGVLSGIGAARLLARTGRARPGVAIALVAASLWGTWQGPLTLDRVIQPEGLALPPAALTPGARAPEIYRFVATLPDSAVLAEFPFADLWYNARYTFASTWHWRRTTNGFTSVYPHSYLVRAAKLRFPVDTPDEAWDQLVASGATHAVVHEAAWSGDYGAQVSAWLRAHGARELVFRDGARLFLLR
jgi:hypothetical protein